MTIFLIRVLFFKLILFIKNFFFRFIFYMHIIKVLILKFNYKTKLTFRTSSQSKPSFKRNNHSNCDQCCCICINYFCYFVNQNEKIMFQSIIATIKMHKIWIFMEAGFKVDFYFDSFVCFPNVAISKYKYLYSILKFS